MSLNLTSIKTPGVYVDEMSLFPPSVAQVDTAIPVFIGLTQTNPTPEPVRISSMAEYRSIFGGSPTRSATVTLTDNNVVRSVASETTNAKYLHDSVLMYFSNGGETCYIVSIGSYASTVAPADYTTAIDKLQAFDEPTLLVAPDAVNLSATQLASVQQALLAHCSLMQDRFSILDVQEAGSSSVSTFRDNLGINNLNYGAAYYPYLKTSLPLKLTYGDLKLSQGGANPSLRTVLGNPTDSDTTAVLTAAEQLADDMAQFRRSFISLPAGTPAGNRAQFITAALNRFITSISGVNKPTTADNVAYNIKDATISTAYTTYNSLAANATKVTNMRAALATTANFDGDAGKDAAIEILNKVLSYVGGFLDTIAIRTATVESDLRRQVPLYAGIVKAAESYGIVLPPSGAIAGVYARTDSTRGVWKSPANISLSYVTAPTVSITDADQTSMNVTSTGKSVNAIRAFTGKGTLVWGARTLAGNDNEWRYVAVRRFFLMAEESIKKATAQFVFEANDANTWVRIRAMVENFLTLQWRAGALAGAKTDQAFFVRVGLGQTMTPQDVLEGRMIVEIGMAVVRPAEFIVLRFSHKMQEA
jgi:phage tail sheath protein FI